MFYARVRQGTLTMCTAGWWCTIPQTSKPFAQMRGQYHSACVNVSPWGHILPYREALYSVNFHTAIMSLIVPLNAHVQLNIVSFTKYLLHVSALTAPSSGKTRITSRNHLLIASLLQWLSNRAENVSNVGFFTKFLTIINKTGNVRTT